MIIPVFNEENYISPLLQQLFLQNPYEIIVVDGGSDDATCKLVSLYDRVNLIHTGKGRALQLNTGAEIANGDIFLFLHADSIIPSTAISDICQILSVNESAGSFCLAFDKQNWWLNIYSRMSRLNYSLFTYGDQGLFVSKDLFEKIGGYPDIPLMEDLEIQKKLRAKGNFIKLTKPIITSSRRYNKHGYVLQQLKNILLVGLYLIGISPKKLIHFYR